MDHTWTVDELGETIQLIKSADFKVEDVNVYQHKQGVEAILQGKITSHNTRESDLHGDIRRIYL